MSEKKSNNICFHKIFMIASENRNLISIIFFIIYIISVYIGVVNHEPWRDEGQAWLIARDLNIFEIFIHTGVEGHPFLWFYILKPFTLLPYYFINIINAIFMVLGVYVLMFKIKIPLWMIFILTFFTPVFYEYPVIARNYGVSFLLCTLMLYLYNKRFDKPILYTVILGLFINTTVIASVIGGVFLLYFQYELILNQKNDNKYSKNKLYAILITGIFFLFLISTQILLMVIERGGAISRVIEPLKNMSFFLSPIISFVFCFVLFLFYLHLLKPSTNTPKPKMNKLFKILTISFVIISALFISRWAWHIIPSSVLIILFLFYHKKFSAFIISLMYFGIICISSFYGVGDRQVGVFLFFAFVYMIYEMYKYNKKITTIISLIMLAIVGIRGLIHVEEFYNDIRFDFSSGYKAANYIKERGFDNKDEYILIPLNGSISSTISPYFDEKIFYNPNIDEYVSFTHWKKNRFVSDRDIHNNYGKEAIFVNYGDKNIEGENLEIITNFVSGESVYFYRLIE